MAGRFWREAASLIVVGRSAVNGMASNMKLKSLDTDYQLLFLKRSSKSTFMPEAYVFPGGALDDSDLSGEWNDIFKSCGHTNKDVKSAFRFPVPLPEIYSNKLDGHILPELAFRICALRETFEETGLLLRSDGTSRSLSSFSTISRDDLISWRKRIINDASQFLSLFKEIGGCPWVWGLHEWSDWLTPLHFNKRYDTAFYVTFIDNFPSVTTDQKEAEVVEVVSPSTMLMRWQKEELWLAPPQVYELCRLLRLNNYKDLHKFAVARELRGLERILPSRIMVKDGWISTLPGDALYPVDIDLTGNTQTEDRSLDCSLSEARNVDKCLNRMEISGLFKCNVITNVQPSCGHLTPNDLPTVFKSSL